MKNGKFEQCVTLLVERFEFEKKSLESCFRRKEKKRLSTFQTKVNVVYYFSRSNKLSISEIFTVDRAKKKWLTVKNPSFDRLLCCKTV